MDSWPTKYFTMEQLAQIALGGPRLAGVNTVVLHSLLDLLLKKLNCQNEKVTITGYEAKQLKMILDSASISPLLFEEQNTDALLKKLDRIDKMEEDITKIGGKLDEHFENIQRHINEDTDPLPPCADFEYDYQFCEDLCANCDPDIKVACDLIENSEFTEKLIGRVSTPMVRRCIILEKKMDVLKTELCKCLARFNKCYEKLKSLDSCFEEVEIMEKEIHEYEQMFLGTMTEVQNILDAKSNQYHILCLKEYIQERLHDILSTLKELKETRKCKKAAAVVAGETTRVSQLQSKLASKTRQERLKRCACVGACLANVNKKTLLERIGAVKINRVKCLLETTGRKSTNSAKPF